MPGKSSWIISLIDRVSKVAEKISKKMNLLSRAFKLMGRAAKWAGKKVVGMARNFATSMKGFVVGMLGMVGVSKVVKAGADFEQSMAGIEAITGITGKKLEFFKKVSIDMSKTFGNSAAEIADGIKMIASEKSELIENPKALEEVTRQSLLLSKAAGITMPEAVKTMVGALNQWQVGAEQAAKFTEILAVGQKIGSANIAQLGESMKNAGVVAAMTGLSFEATVATLEVLGSAGLKGAEAGTALRSAMLKMDQAMGKAGPSVAGWNKALENLVKSGIDGKGMMKLFGLESVTVGNVLLNDVTKIRRWTEEIGGTRDALRQARVQMDTFHGKSSRLQRFLDAKMITVFDKMNESGQMDSIFARLSNDIDKLDTDKIINFINGLIALFQGFSFVAGLVMDILTPIAAILKGISINLIESIGGVFKGGDFSDMTTAKEGFSIGGKVLGGLPSWLENMLGIEEKGKIEGVAQNNIKELTGEKEKLEVDITLKGNTSAVEKVETKSRTLPTKTSLAGA